MPIYGSIVILDSKSGGGAAYTLTANSCLFGSSSNCDVRIQKTNIAPEHCMIQVHEDGRIVLRNLAKQLDLPVKVNNYDVQDIAIVHDKDVFEVGDIKFRWEMPEHFEGVTSPDFSNGSPTITTTLQPTSILVKPVQILQSGGVFSSIPENLSRHVKALLGVSKPPSNTEISHSQPPAVLAELQEDSNQETISTNIKIEPVDNEVMSIVPLNTSAETPSSPKPYESLSALLLKNIHEKSTSETPPSRQIHKSASSLDTLTTTPTSSKSSAASAPISDAISTTAPISKDVLIASPIIKEMSITSTVTKNISTTDSALDKDANAMKTPEPWASELPNILKEEKVVNTAAGIESPQMSTESPSPSKQSLNVAIVSKKPKQPRKRRAASRSRKSVSKRKRSVETQRKSTSTVRPRVTRRSVTTRKSYGNNKGIVSLFTRSVSPSSSQSESCSVSGTADVPTHSATSEKVSKAKGRGRAKAVKSLPSRAQPKVPKKTNKRSRPTAKPKSKTSRRRRSGAYKN